MKISILADQLLQETIQFTKASQEQLSEDFKEMIKRERAEHNIGESGNLTFLRTG